MLAMVMATIRDLVYGVAVFWFYGVQIKESAGSDKVLFCGVINYVPLPLQSQLEFPLRLRTPRPTKLPNASCSDRPVRHFCSRSLSLFII